MKPIKVLIVDDSKFIQTILTQIFSMDPEVHVVGAADDAFMARDMIKELNPDIITLDISMPGMDGITFLRNLMRLRPMPVVMISSFTAKGADLTLEALALGAIDFLLKPSESDLTKNLAAFANQVLYVVKSAANANIKYYTIPHNKYENLKLTATELFLKEQVIAIGASTGGVSAIDTILSQLPPLLPALVICQHIRKEIVESFARRMNEHYNFITAIPKTFEPLKPGHIYIAPGDIHLQIGKTEKDYQCLLSGEPRDHIHKPSIDVLFSSVAKSVGRNAVGVLLTGMGADGALGLKEILQAGGNTIAQDEETSVVWGMPKTAVDLQAAEYILPIDDISKKIIDILNERARDKGAEP